MSFFNGRLELSGVEDLATGVDVTGSFSDGQVTFGSTRDSGLQVTFSGDWNADRGLAGTFTYEGEERAHKGTWTGKWGAVRPGAPADAVEEEYAEALPVFREEQAPLDLDPDDPYATCVVLDDPQRMSLMSPAAERALRRRCEVARWWREPCPGNVLSRLLDRLLGGISSAWAQVTNARVNSTGSDTYPTITQSEVTMAVSGSSASTVVAAYNDSSYGLGDYVSYSRSTDSGSSWGNKVPLSGGAGKRVNGDPVIASALNGNFYLGVLLETTPNVKEVIGVARSTNGGVSFPSPFADASPNSTMVDKPEIAVDRFLSSPGAGNIYVCWKDSGTSKIEFSRSTNDGVNYTQLGAGLSAGTNVTGCSVAVSPSGNVYVAWWDGSPSGGLPANRIRFRRSTDMGVSFDTEVELGSAILAPDENCCNATPGIHSPALNGRLRSFPFANLATDPLAPNNVYLVWNTYTCCSSEVFFRRSTNGGALWDLPVRLNDTLTNDQFMPRIATGVLFEATPNVTQLKVIWYDRKDDGANSAVRVYADSSGDGGATWGTDVQWTTASSPLPQLCVNGPGGRNFDCNANPCYFGDYNGIVSLNPASSKFVLGWGDTRDNNPGNGSVDCAGGTSSPDPNVYRAVGC